MDFRATLDPQSLAQIAQMFGFSTFLEPEVREAMTRGSQLIAQAAQDNTWSVFENPSGALADTIEADTTSPYEAQVVVGSPYGRRRELGFSGMTDSLGRYYANDPGKPYLQPAMDSNEQAVLAMMEAAVNATLGRIGGA